MSAAKFILLGLAVLSVLVIAGAVLWVKYYAGDFATNTASTLKTTIAEGKSFGRTSNVDGCLKKTIELSASCGIMNLACQTDKQMFMQACIRTAPDIQARCESVPKDDLMAQIGWGLETCAALGYAGEKRCQQVVGAVPSYCARHMQKPPPG